MDERGQVTVYEEEEGLGPRQKTRELLARVLKHIGKDPRGTPAKDSLGTAGTAQELLLEIQLDGYQYKLYRRWLRAPVPAVQLSPRENEIVRMVAQGLPNKGIAELLEISPWTVATHLRRVYNKLGVNSRAEMIARVLENSLLDLT